METDATKKHTYHEPGWLSQLSYFLTWLGMHISSPGVSVIAT